MGAILALPTSVLYSSHVAAIWFWALQEAILE